MPRRPRAVKSAGYGIGRVHKASPCAGLSAGWLLQAAHNHVPGL